MHSLKDNNRKNQNLVLFKRGIRNYSESDKFLEWVLKNFDDINQKIEPTEYLLKHHPDMIGNTVLHLAYSWWYYEEHLHILLSQGADFTIQNYEKKTILHSVLWCKRSKKFLFPDLRSRLDNKYVDIILSAHLETKNPTNPCDSNGMSHFHIACMANNVELVEFFLDNNVFIDDSINADSPYFPGFTALHLAVRCCCLQVTRLLLKRGANIYLKNAEKMTVCYMVLNNYLRFYDEIFCGSDYGSEMSLENMNKEIAKLLLETVSNSDAGLSCLHLYFILMNSSKYEDKPMEKDINHSINLESPLWRGWTALHFASLVDTGTVIRLIKKGANLLTIDANGKTPLDLCIERSDLETVQSILSLNSVYQKITLTRKRIKFLSLIDSMKDCKQLKLFLDKYPNSSRISIPTDAPLWPGFTPLHLVVLFSSLKSFRKSSSPECFWTSKDIRDNNKSDDFIEKHLQMITELYNRNKSIITAQDVRGRTALHLSFRLGKIEKVVDFLLNLLDKINTPL